LRCTLLELLENMRQPTANPAGINPEKCSNLAVSSAIACFKA
jgi:hypothetical protein